MKIANEFTVSAPIEQAWDVLNDLEQVMPLMPGAQLTGRDGDDVLGKVKVKVGPVTSEFSGKVHFVEQDRDSYRAVIDAKGKESRGSRATRRPPSPRKLHEAGEQTRVTVDTDLKIVGKLAQFGSGMLQQVSEKLLGQFVDSLEAKLVAEAAPAAAPEAAVPPCPASRGDRSPTTRPAAPPAAEPAPIDLLELAGGTALKKYGPVVVALFAAAAAVFAFGRVLLAADGWTATGGERPCPAPRCRPRGLRGRAGGAAAGRRGSSYRPAARPDSSRRSSRWPRVAERAVLGGAAHAGEPGGGPGRLSTPCSAPSSAARCSVWIRWA